MAEQNCGSNNPCSSHSSILLQIREPSWLRRGLPISDASPTCEPVRSVEEDASYCPSMGSCPSPLTSITTALQLLFQIHKVLNSII